MSNVKHHKNCILNELFYCIELNDIHLHQIDSKQLYVVTLPTTINRQLLYSYRTCIGIRRAGTWSITAQRYSVTTSRQINEFTSLAYRGGRDVKRIDAYTFDEQFQAILTQLRELQLLRRVEDCVKAAKLRGQSCEIDNVLPTVLIVHGADDEFFFQEQPARELLDSVPDFCNPADYLLYISQSW